MGAFETGAYGASKSTEGPCTNACVVFLYVLALYVQQKHASTFSGQYFICRVTSFSTNACQPRSIFKNPKVLIVASKLMATHDHDSGKQYPPIMIERFQSLTAESSHRTS